MFEFKNLKVKQFDKIQDIFLEVDGGYKGFEEYKELIIQYWINCLCEYWSQQFDGWVWEEKGGLNQEFKFLKNGED